MSSSQAFIPFKERGGLWQDVAPLEQYEGGAAPICPIAYTSEYKEVMGYFRAVFVAQEMSERAFELTTETIMLNQGNYTAWHYRRKLLHELNRDLGSEIIWLNSIGLLMEKNYQIWHHRRCIFEMWIRKSTMAAQDEEQKQSQEIPIHTLSIESFKEVFDMELEFLKDIFDSDAKNYHAWSHKIWLIERYQLWQEPRHLEFVEQMLDNDVQNNSVWSFRYFIIMRSADHRAKAKGSEGFSRELVEAECKYVLAQRLPSNWRNEAAWAYLRGLLATSKEEAELSMSSNARRCFIGDMTWMKEAIESWMAVARQEQFSKDMVQPGDGTDPDQAESVAFMRHQGLRHNRFLHATHVDFLIAASQFDEATKCLNELKQFDAIRHKFWEWRRRQVQALQ